MTTERELTITDEYLGSYMGDHPEVVAAANDTVSSTIDTYTRKNIRVHVTRPAEVPPERIVIVPRSYEATYTSDDGGIEAARDRVLAQRLHGVVVGVDTPGFSADRRAKSNWRGALEMLFRGRMKSHTSFQLEAIREALHSQGIELNQREVEVQLVGYSLGATAVTYMLGQLEKQAPDVTVSSVDLIEPVSDQNFSLFGKSGLLQSIGRETSTANVDRYLGQNVRHGLPISYDRTVDGSKVVVDEKSSTEMAKIKRRGLLGNLALGIGMRKGFSKDLLRALQSDRYSKTKIRIIRADGSEVAREAANQQTADMLSRAGKDITKITLLHSEAELDASSENKHHHPWWQSLPVVALVLDEVRKFGE